MKNRRFIIAGTLTFFLMLGSFLNFAQTTDVGSPKSWLAKTTLKTMPFVALPDVNTEILKSQDAVTDAERSGPWRFGYHHEINTDLLQNGVWDNAYGGGRTCRMEFASKDALTMNLFFSAFQLPEGAHLHVYNSDRSIVDGAYTHANNQPDKELATIPVSGQRVVVEYYEPAGKLGQAEVVIKSVIHGYRPIRTFFNAVYDEAKALNQAGKCNYDTKCSQIPGSPFGAPGEWDEQIASVAIMMNNGSSFCSGALVNNTANNGTPYFLSANHCGTNYGGGLTFMFKWESPTAVCATNANSSNGPTSNVINGGILRANRSGSDFALWQMNSTPPASYNIYYSGWSRATTQPTQATGIHHPRGDVKKICRENNSPYQSSAGGAQVWWINQWELGVTEPGSSGSPLFDQNKRIVGQLYGGLSACSGTQNNGSYDYYGRFDVSWNTGTTAATRLSDWLDPLGTNPVFIDGYNPNAPTGTLDAAITNVAGLGNSSCNQSNFQPAITLANFGTSVLTSATINIQLSGSATQNIPWTGNLTPGQSTQVVLPGIIISNPGAYVYTVTVSGPNGSVDINPSNNSVVTPFTVSLNAQTATLSILLDCWGAETSWQVVNDESGLVVANGGPYLNGTGGSIQNTSICLPEGCYTFTIFDSFGDGLAGAQYPSCTTNGDYFMTSDVQGELLVIMDAPNGNFGSQAVHTFCVGTPAPLCSAPYLTPTGLTSANQANGVLLTWNPVPGSTSCRLEGGLANGAGPLQSVQVNGTEPSQYLVPASIFAPQQRNYRWRARCRCSAEVQGPWSGYSNFSWPIPAPTAADGIFHADTEVNIYPNPSGGALFISFMAEGEAQVSLRVMDMIGKLVYSQNTVSADGMNNYELDLNHLPQGMYLLDITDGVNRITKKVAINK
jgi:hypothetical protein